MILFSERLVLFGIQDNNPIELTQSKKYVPVTFLSSELLEWHRPFKARDPRHSSVLSRPVDTQGMNTEAIRRL